MRGYGLFEQHSVYWWEPDGSYGWTHDYAGNWMRSLKGNWIESSTARVDRIPDTGALLKVGSLPR